MRRPADLRLLLALVLYASVPGRCQTPVVSAFVTLFNAVPATGTQTSAFVRIPNFSGYGTLSLTGSGIAGSPAGCQLAVSFETNLGAPASAATQTFTFTPENNYQAFPVGSMGTPSADQISVVYSCATYPSGGTLNATFSPTSGLAPTAYPRILLFNSVSATGTQTSSVVDMPMMNAAMDVALIGSGITWSGLPQQCQLAFSSFDRGVNSGALGTLAFTPANGATDDDWNPSSSAFNTDQIGAVYSCTTYPTGGTLTVVLYPVPSIPLLSTAANLSPSATHWGAITEKGGRWSVFSTPNPGLQATASRGAATTNTGQSIYHVADCIFFSAAAITAPAATFLSIVLQDGPSGTGTTIWQQNVAAPASVGTHVTFGTCGLNLRAPTGNNPMTLEFTGALANEAESVALTGYDVF